MLEQKVIHILFHPQNVHDISKYPDKNISQNSPIALHLPIGL